VSAAVLVPAVFIPAFIFSSSVWIFRLKVLLLSGFYEFVLSLTHSMPHCSKRRKNNIQERIQTGYKVENTQRKTLTI
jgi:hypothetical protein